MSGPREPRSTGPPTDELTCPRCETDEHLTGAADGDVIHIRCGGCGLAWDRDTRPRCVTCGRTDSIHIISQPVIEKARGTQLSIVGVTTTYLCDHHYRTDYLTRGYRHIPPGHNPAG